MQKIHITRMSFLILLTFLFSLPTFAQNEEQSGRNAVIAARSRQLRFASQRPVENLRLQVRDSAGSLIHDSGVVAKSDLVWSLGDDKGNALKSGFYDWTLTIKEPGKSSPRVKLGQFSLESMDHSNLARPSEPAALVVGGSGTVNSIPKWTTTTDLGDSVIAEDNGNVSIGSSPSGIIKLRVFLKPADRNAHETIQAVLTSSFYDDPVNDDLDGQTTGSAVAGFATNTVGGTSGVTGVSYSEHGTGVFGSAVSNIGKTIGVKGVSHSPDGIGTQGVAGSITGENIGVRGESLSDAGVGVLGEMNVTNGVTFGVKGLNSGTNGRGVLGHATDTTGVNYGVVGRTESPNGFAGFFIGRVHVAGFLSKAAGAFKIDHPLDPENKTLSHSFVESPEMMNIYNGIVTLGKDGSAEVTLPDWFEALNREFRYQLTSIGGFAPVYIAKKVNTNRFKIAGGKPGMEVSWQLTGVRKDAYAESNRIQVEEMKPAEERGSYLHPEAFGRSVEKSAQRVYERAQQR